MNSPKVLIVEDDSAIRTLLVAALRREPLEVHMASDGMAALDCVGEHDFAVILLDLMMPRLNGFDFIDAFAALRPSATPVVIVMTAFDKGILGRLDASRVHAILHKPFDMERVVDMVRDSAVAHESERARQPQQQADRQAEQPDEVMMAAITGGGPGNDLVF